MEFLLANWQTIVALLGATGIASPFLTIGKSSLFDIVKSLFTKSPATPDTTNTNPTLQNIPPVIAAVLGPFLQQLLQKKPVTLDPEKPIVVPENTFDFVKLLKELTDLPESQLTNPVVEKTDHQATVAHLVECAEAVGKLQPNNDILIEISQGKVSVINEERKPANAK